MRLPDHINVKEFGAVGDGVVDDTTTIQTALDFIIANANAPKRLYFPAGTYKITSPLMIYKWDGANYQFVTVELVGSEGAHFGPTAQTTNIVCTQKDTFAIGIQGGKGVAIKGLAITGEFELSFGTNKAWIDAAKDYSTLGAANLCRDSQYSPYSGVVVDPFTTVAPADGGYPGMGSWYRGVSDAASSGINIEGCGIRQFVVGVMYSPNGVSQNTESCNIDNSTIETCKVAVSYGHDQTKQCNITRCVSWTYTHTFIDNLRYGQSNGCPGNIDGLDLAGSVYQMANINTTGRVGSSIRNVFAESIFKVGTIKGSPTTLEGSQFEFMSAVTPDIGTPDLFMDISNVHVSGCTFKNYDNLFNKRLAIKSSKCTFANVHWDLPPLILDSADLNVSGNDRFPEFINSTFGNGYLGAIGKPDETNHDASYLPTIALSGDFHLRIKNPFANYGQYEVEFNEGGYQRSIEVEPSTTVTINDTLRTGSLTVTSAALFAYINVGDYLVAYVGGSPASLGRVSAVNAGTREVTLAEVSTHLSTDTFVNITLTYVRYFGHPFIGDSSVGSAIISNVVAPFGYPTAGDRIESVHFGSENLYESERVGAYIISVDAGAKTVTLNTVAIATSKQTNFGCSKPKFRVRNTFDITTNANEVLPKGTEYFFEDKSSTGDFYTVKRYVVERGGLVSGVPQAVWYEALDARSNSGVLEYFNKSTQAWVPYVSQFPVITSGAATLALSTGGAYHFTGTTTTWSLPTIAASATGTTYFIKNKGSGNITLDVVGGASTIYDTSAVASLTIAAGSYRTVVADGTHWAVH